MTRGKKHGASFEVTKRQPGGKATEWAAKCDCHRTTADRFYGASYEEVEDQWRRHVYDLTGTAPQALGRTTSRWMPS